MTASSSQYRQSEFRYFANRVNKKYNSYSEDLIYLEIRYSILNAMVHLIFYMHDHQKRLKYLTIAEAVVFTLVFLGIMFLIYAGMEF